MDEIDILLSIIENPTRRRILEALVREPHYPLQLSRELGLSQQGIMKHLKVLEDYNIVRSSPGESDQGGPARKVYVPTMGFSIVIDVGPGLFNTALVRREIGDTVRKVSAKEEFAPKARGLREEIVRIDNDLEVISRRREELIRRKEIVLEEAAAFVEAMAHGYQTRRILFEYIQRPADTIEDIAADLGIRDDIVKRTIENYEEETK
ncbi:MAG: helix-turn-helix domain-containing protein [Methanomassiliicoccales archaeon]